MLEKCFVFAGCTLDSYQVLETARTFLMIHYQSWASHNLIVNSDGFLLSELKSVYMIYYDMMWSWTMCGTALFISLIQVVLYDWRVTCLIPMIYCYMESSTALVIIIHEDVIITIKLRHLWMTCWHVAESWSTHHENTYRQCISLLWECITICMR